MQRRGPSKCATRVQQRGKLTVASCETSKNCNVETQCQLALASSFFPGSRGAALGARLTW